MNLRKWLEMQNRLLEQADGGEGGGGAGGNGGSEGSDGSNSGSGGNGESDNDGDDVDGLKKKLESEKGEKQKVIAESMKRKDKINDLSERLKQFDGVDLDKYKDLIEKEEKAQEEAKKRELEDAEKKGQFDKIKAQMIEHHNEEIDGLKTELAASNAESEKLRGQIVELTVGAEFSNSNFLTSETLLTGKMARRMFGDHFDVEDGKVVGYDKPRGAKDRAPLVDAQSNPVSFDKAIEKIISLEPNKDDFLKAKGKDGAGSKSNNQGSGKGKSNTEDLHGKTRIGHALLKQQKN